MSNQVAPAPDAAANSQQLVQSAATLAQSPLEAGGLDWGDAPSPGGDATNPAAASSQQDYQQRFDQARARDGSIASTAKQRADAAAPGAQQAATPAATPDKGLNWKPRKAADWEAVHAKHNATVAQLQAEIAQLRGGPAAGNPAQAQPAAASSTPPADITQDERFQQLQQAQSREREQQMRTTFKKELQRWQDPDNGMPFTIPNDANNKEVTAIATRAEDILFGRIKDDAEFAAIGLKAATFDHVIRYAAQLADDYATLRANYDRVMGAQPSDSSYAGPANAGPGHGAAAPEANGNAPLLMSDPAGFAQQLTARRQADATRGAYRG
jgi:hypothetical protein